MPKLSTDTATRTISAEAAQGLVAVASQRKDEAADKLRKLEDQCEVLRREVADWETFITRTEFLTEVDPSIAPGKSGPCKVRKGSLAATIAEVLASVKKLSLDDLYVELAARGLGKNSVDYRTVINTAIWRRKDLFKKDLAGGYSLAPNGFEIVES